MCPSYQCIWWSEADFLCTASKDLASVVLNSDHMAQIRLNSSVKPPRRRRIWFKYYEAYLNQIHQCQDKGVLQFILRAPGSIWKLGVVFEIPNCQVWLKLSILNITDNMGFTPRTYLWVFGTGRSIKTQVLLNSTIGQHYRCSSNPQILSQKIWYLWDKYYLCQVQMRKTG